MSMTFYKMLTKTKILSEQRYAISYLPQKLVLLCEVSQNETYLIKSSLKNESHKFFRSH